MAQQLIESLTTEFDPGQYRDEYRDAVMEMIERKAEGHEIEIAAPADEAPEEVPDLMAALEASISGSKRQSKPKSQGQERLVERLEGRSRRPSRSPRPRARPRRSSVAASPSRSNVEGRKLRLSNLDKVLYPEAGFTKGQVIDYYTRAAPGAAGPPARARPDAQALPQRGGRQVLLREAEALARARVGAVDADRERPRGDHRVIDYVLCDDLPTMVWLANLADLELHPSLALAEDPDSPVVMAFDLDPGAPAALGECCEVALILRDALDHLGLECHAKTSGSKGMQVYVPLNSGAGTTTTPSRSRTGWQGAGAAPRPDRLGDEEGGPQGQGLHRLEPERPAQDHRGALLAACARRGPRCPRRWAGTRWTTARAAARATWCSRRATCWSGSRSTATCSPRAGDPAGAAGQL